MTHIVEATLLLSWLLCMELVLMQKIILAYKYRRLYRRIVTLFICGTANLISFTTIDKKEISGILAVFVLMGCSANGTQQTYVESIVYPWWNETSETWIWTARCAKDSCTYQGTFSYGRKALKHILSEMWSYEEQDNLFSRLCSFTSSGISREEFWILFQTSGLDYDIPVSVILGICLKYRLLSPSNSMSPGVDRTKMVDQLLLLFLLEDYAFSGDLWRLVMAHHIEIMQEAQLCKMQTQNCSSRVQFERELEFLEDKRDRAQLELSLYSQATDVFQLQLGCTFSRVGSGSLRQPDLVHMKCREWLSGISTGKSNSAGEGRLESTKDKVPAIVKEEPISIVSKLMTIYTMLVLPEVTQHPYHLVSTWVEECMEEYYMDDRAMEQMSLQMLILQVGDLSDVQAEQHFLEAQLSLMQSRLQHAQTEVELLSDTIQYLSESNTTLLTQKKAVDGLTPNSCSHNSPP
ncbi:uncharacterized protein BJ212DRAFT_1294811 [Suillus subaureus]|uniref:Uncharacterized protein n=1 Tax=Suillus subaureus TaxID=48587 RepID=A0A9P7JKU0_9AGAM|nr:uncharacterized protein BJ212DRAFT_1294811 [Suillus subaureus]KAG1827579.1 hypothetical protein BJ212DRAFT_1294811 [Suillus subaureus]